MVFLNFWKIIKSFSLSQELWAISDLIYQVSYYNDVNDTYLKFSDKVFDLKNFAYH